MIDKIASSGLSFHQLNIAFQRDSIDGVKNVLSEKIDGKPRVSNTNCIISKIQDYLEQRQGLKSLSLVHLSFSLYDILTLPWRYFPQIVINIMLSVFVLRSVLHLFLKLIILSFLLRIISKTLW